MAAAAGGDLYSWEDVAAAISRNVRTEWPLYAMLATGMAGGFLGDLRRKRSLRSRYLTRFFLTDVIYTAWDLSHVWHLLVLGPLSISLVKISTPWLSLDSVASLPVAAQIAVASIFTDFCNYWFHRLQHSNEWLWQFHKVHNSQQQLSALTAFRQPLLTRMFTALVLAAPAAIMGASAAVPFAIMMLLLLHQTLEHSNTGWTYGLLGRIIVSPSYHELQHSAAPEHHNKNFSPVLTIWDYFFDTRGERNDE